MLDDLIRSLANAIRIIDVLSEREGPKFYPDETTAYERAVAILTEHVRASGVKPQWWDEQYTPDRARTLTDSGLLD